MEDTMSGGSEVKNADVSDAVTVNVRCCDGKQLAVHVSLSWSVEMLKCLLADKCEIEADQQRLIYNGRFLKNDHTLMTYGLEAGHTVHLIRGSVPAASNDPENKTTTSSPTTILPVVSTEERTMSGVASSLFPTLNLNGLGDNSGIFLDRLPDFDQILQQLTLNPNMMMNNPGETLTHSPAPNTNPLLNLSNAAAGAGANRRNAAATHPAVTDRSTPPVEFGFTSDPNSMTHLMQNPDLISQRTLTPVTREQRMALQRFLYSRRGRLEGSGDAGQADRGTAPPQERYIGELTHLQQMGFLDNRENLQALEATAGNVSAAVEQLLGNPN